jgi:hypothetical protein
MTEISNAKKLLDQCQGIEDAIYDDISFCMTYAHKSSLQYHISCVPELANECRQQSGRLVGTFLGTKMTLGNKLSRMAKRLEAAAMYAQNRLNADNPTDT